MTGNRPDSTSCAPPQSTMSANTRGVFSNGYANAGKGRDWAKEVVRACRMCPAFGLKCPASRMCGVLREFFQTRVCGLGTKRTVPKWMKPIVPTRCSGTILEVSAHQPIEVIVLRTGQLSADELGELAVKLATATSPAEIALLRAAMTNGFYGQ